MAKQNKTSGRGLLLLLAVIAAALCAAAVLLDPLDMFGGSDLPEAKKPSSESSQQFSDPVQAEGVSVQVPILLYHHISEDTLTQEQFQTEMQLLKDGGRLCLCTRPARLTDCMVAMRLQGIEPKRLRFVRQRPGKGPWLFLLDGRRHGKPGLVLMEDLVIEAAGGGFSAELLRIYGDPGREDGPGPTPKKEEGGL